MKENTIKILSGICVIAICLSPINASQFNFSNNDNLAVHTEEISESCNFVFTHFNGSIGIK